MRKKEKWGIDLIIFWLIPLKIRSSLLCLIFPTVVAESAKRSLFAHWPKRSLFAHWPKL